LQSTWSGIAGPFLVSKTRVLNQTMPAKPRRTIDTTRPFAIEAARLLRDRHCEDVRLLDVRGLSQVCDYVLIGTGTSDRQMKSVAHEMEQLGAEQDNKVYRSSRDDGGTWIVVDFVNLVAHLFEPHQRDYYDMETLWNEAETVNWEDDAPKSARRTGKAAPARSARNDVKPTSKKKTATRKTASRKKA
jgi:ribosome-associated protein